MLAGGVSSQGLGGWDLPMRSLAEGKCCPRPESLRSQLLPEHLHSEPTAGDVVLPQVCPS